MVTCYISAYFTGTALRSTPAKHLPCIGEFNKPPPHRMTHRCPCLNPGVARGKIQSVIPLLHSFTRYGSKLKSRWWFCFSIRMILYYYLISECHLFHQYCQYLARCFSPVSYANSPGPEADWQQVYRVRSGCWDFIQLGTTGRSCDRWLICRRIMKVPTLYIFIWYCVYVIIYIYTVDVYIDIDMSIYIIRCILSGY